MEDFAQKQGGGGTRPLHWKEWQQSKQCVGRGTCSRRRQSCGTASRQRRDTGVLGPPWSGSDSALRDAEVLEMLATFLDELGIKGWRLALNSVGSAEDRKRYSAALREALVPVKDRMSADNQRRAETNPLRVLDS